MRGRDPGVLVRVRVTEHHFLGVARAGDDPAVAAAPTAARRAGRRRRAARRPSRGAGTKPMRAPAPAGSTRPGLAGEDDGGENVVGALGHRDDVRLDDSVAETIEGRRDRAGTCRASLGVIVRGRRTVTRAVACSASSSASSAVRPSCRARCRAGRARRGGRTSRRARRGAFGVLAHVEGGDSNPKVPTSAADPAHDPVGDRTATVRGERVGQQSADRR